MAINTAIDTLRLLAWISAYLILSPPVLCFVLFLHPSLLPLPPIYQIAWLRSQLSPVGGSFLG